MSDVYISFLLKLVPLFTKEAEIRYVGVVGLSSANLLCSLRLSYRGAEICADGGEEAGQAMILHYLLPCRGRWHPQRVMIAAASMN